MEGPRRLRRGLLRHSLSCGCLLLSLGCVVDQTTTVTSDETAVSIDLSTHQTPHADTCVAFGDFQARASLDPGRSGFEKEQMQDRAQRAYRQAIKLDRHCVNAYIGLGRLYQAMEDQERALKTYQEGLAQLPTSATLWYEKGACEARQGQWTSAVQSLQSAVANDAENRTYIKTLAFCLGRAGRFDESLACFRKVTNEAQAHYDLARLLHHMHEEKRCREHLQVALSIRPDMTQASELLAQLAVPSNPTPKPAPAPVIVSAPITKVGFEEHAITRSDDRSDDDGIARIGTRKD